MWRYQKLCWLFLNFAGYPCSSLLLKFSSKHPIRLQWALLPSGQRQRPVSLPPGDARPSRGRREPQEGTSGRDDGRATPPQPPVSGGDRESSPLPWSWMKVQPVPVRRAQREDGRGLWRIPSVAPVKKWGQRFLVPCRHASRPACLLTRSFNPLSCIGECQVHFQKLCATVKARDRS